jgi:hypothetical protein
MEGAEPTTTPTRCFPVSAWHRNLGSGLARLCVLTALGCGSAKEDVEPVAQGELVVELIPQDHHTLPGIYTPVDPAAEPVVLQAEWPVSVALGPEYPDALTIALGEPFGCEDDVFEIRSIEAGDGAPLVEQLSSNELRFTPSGEGDYMLLVTGVVVSPPEGAMPLCAHRAYGRPEVDFELTIPLKVRRPVTAAIVWPRHCANAETPRLASGARLPDQLIDRLRVYAVDSAGEQFTPANADPRRPVTVNVRGHAKASLVLAEPDEGLPSLIVTGADGDLTFEAFGREFASAELIGRRRIDAVDAVFGLQAIKGSGTLLVEGETYGADGWRTEGTMVPLTGSIDVAVVAEYAEGAPICTVASPDAFSFSSATRDVCTVVDAPGHGDQSASSSYVYLASSAQVLAAGTCTLELRASDYAGGQGWSTAMSVELVNVEDLTVSQR